MKTNKLCDIANRNAMSYYNPSSGTAFHIPGNLNVTSEVFFSGIVHQNPKKFKIEFLKGITPTEVVLCYEVQPKDRTIFLDSKHVEKFGDDERTGAFPFSPSSTFLMHIQIVTDCLEMEINQKKQIVVKLRDAKILNDVNFLKISGDVNILSFHVLRESFPPPPYHFVIPDNAILGDIFSFHGVSPQLGQGFSINFSNNAPLGDEDDIYFQFSPLFEFLSTNNQQKESLVVRNARINQKWISDGERLGGMPFEVGHPFSLDFVVGVDGLHCWINERYFCLWKHCMPYSSISSVTVENQVSLTSFIMDRASAQLPAEIGKDVQLDSSRADVMNFFAPTPNRLKLPKGFAPGKCIAVSGMVKSPARRFAIYIECGPEDDPDIIIYRYSVLFDQVPPAVTQNARKGDWGVEEVITANFPFCAFGRFQLQIFCNTNGDLNVIVDGKANAVFHGRIDCSLAEYLCISGDVRVHRIMVL